MSLSDPLVRRSLSWCVGSSGATAKFEFQTTVTDHCHCLLVRRSENATSDHPTLKAIFQLEKKALWWMLRALVRHSKSMRWIIRLHWSDSPTLGVSDYPVTLCFSCFIVALVQLVATVTATWYLYGGLDVSSVNWTSRLNGALDVLMAHWTSWILLGLYPRDLKNPTNMILQTL